jgi:hypothetical protein
LGLKKLERKVPIEEILKSSEMAKKTPNDLEERLRSEYNMMLENFIPSANNKLK